MWCLCRASLPAVLLLAVTFALGNVFAEEEASWMTTPELFFELSTGDDEVDFAYLLAMAEVDANIVNGTFIAGAGWDQLWTRDTSYAVELAAGLLHPDMSKKSLQKSIEVDEEFGDVWLQDVCGHFGGWPNLSDAIVGVRGAWSLFLTSGDFDFLSWAYKVTKNSLARAERDAYDLSSGLFKGCSSFMESDSGYPQKYSMNGTLLGETKALSTNMLYYEGYKLGSEMASLLGKRQDEVDSLRKKAAQLRKSIRSRLWSHRHGYYAYFEDEFGARVPQMEGLGEALVLLGTDFERSSHSYRSRVDRIFENTYRTEHGIPSLWPRFVYSEDAECKSEWIECYYHNGRVWPFVQGYWGLAAARHKRVSIFAQEFENLVWLSQQQNTFAEFYEIDGSFPRVRSRQLWSDAGFLCLVYYGLFGMEFVTEGVRFHPVKPANLFNETISLKGVRYRSMTLDIYVSGSGSNVMRFLVDGYKQHHGNSAFIPADIEGCHTVSIVLHDNHAMSESQEDEEGYI